MPGLSCSLHRWTRLSCLVDACTAVQNMFCSMMEEGVFLYLSVCTKIPERSGLTRPAYFGRRQNPEYLCVDKVTANRFNYQCYCCETVKKNCWCWWVVCSCYNQSITVLRSMRFINYFMHVLVRVQTPVDVWICEAHGMR